VGSSDFVLMDCGPSLGVLTLNALATADEVFIPLQPHFLALHGLSKLLETTALVARRINPRLVVSGVVVCLYDAATKLAQEVVSDLSAFLEKSRGANVPWANARVFGTRIRRNIKLAECPSFGKSVFAYAPKSSGAADYAALAMEVMGDAAPTVIGPLKLKPEAVEVPQRQTTLEEVA
jgi:chromosome partitioning protein